MKEVSISEDDRCECEQGTCIPHNFDGEYHCCDRHATVVVRTIFGTFRMCDSCAKAMPYDYRIVEFTLVLQYKSGWEEFEPFKGTEEDLCNYIKTAFERGFYKQISVIRLPDGKFYAKTRNNGELYYT